jgi:predicted transcriptional regulator
MSALERHYTAKEIAELWQLSEDTVRKIFRDTPGVLKIAQPTRRFKRAYVSLRIPESVVQKRHAELHAAVPRALA